MSTLWLVGTDKGCDRYHALKCAKEVKKGGLSIMVWPDGKISGQQEKARETLRKTKEKWGLTWPEMAKFLPYPETTLRVYASRGKYVPVMPQEMIDILLQLEGAPSPEMDLPSGGMAVALLGGKVDLIKLELRTCRYCGRLFAPKHPQQQYCDTYTGECGLAMRRRRYKEKGE